MSELLDSRPGGIDRFYRPGDPALSVVNWPTGTLAGRTFTSSLGAASLGVSIVGDVMSITATPAQTAAAAPVEVWKLVDTTAADDVTVFVGRWAASDNASELHETTVVASTATGTVGVTTQGMSSVGDLTVAGSLVVNHPLVFWQHTTNIAQTLANATWTPIAWNNMVSTIGQGWTSYVPASTTIAAGSDTAVLPQGTINVASTTGFKAATSSDLGYLVIRIGGKDVVVAYTGKNATQFTGCTFGVGTLATGQAVAQANVEFNVPVNTIGPLIAELAWASNGTGGRWTRVRFLNAFAPGVHLNGATGFTPAIASADPLIRSVAVEQPRFGGSAFPLRIEGYQTSTGPLDCAPDQLAAPRLVIQALSSVAP